MAQSSIYFKDSLVSWLSLMLPNVSSGVLPGKTCFQWEPYLTGWNRKRFYLHHHRVEHVTLCCCQSIILQSQDQLRSLVWSQSQQMFHPVPERSLLYVTHALPVRCTGALPRLGHADPLLNVTEEGLRGVTRFGEAGQRWGRCSHCHLLACKVAESLTSNTEQSK